MKQNKGAKVRYDDGKVRQFISANVEMVVGRDFGRDAEIHTANIRILMPTGENVFTSEKMSSVLTVTDELRATIGDDIDTFVKKRLVRYLREYLEDTFERGYIVRHCDHELGLCYIDDMENCSGIYHERLHGKDVLLKSPF